jgi:hypothetical protein
VIFQSGIGSELQSIMAEMRSGSGVEMGWYFRVEVDQNFGVELDQSCRVLWRKCGAEMRGQKQKETRKWSEKREITWQIVVHDTVSKRDVFKIAQFQNWESEIVGHTQSHGVTDIVNSFVGTTTVTFQSIWHSLDFFQKN